ncbi:MAG TPA: serine hydrolase domain-containing protein [Acidimicrobiales bacterium]|nr:serine hydrolase domain-containing protein [Acidimicrobiales bacterium]
MRALEAISDFGARNASAGVVGPGGVLAARGDVDHPFAWASVTKLCTALAVLVAVEERSISLDDQAGPPGSTVRHLLAHASGLGPDEPDQPLVAPGKRRIYSNAGFEVLAAFLERRTGMSFASYLGAAVLEPLSMTGTRLVGTAAAGVVGTLRDLIALGTELLSPSLVDQATLLSATSVAFAGLSGVLPGFGRQDPCDWGLGPELRAGKSPHWTGSRNSPATFGHFGQSGTFLWVDPAARLGCALLTDRPFGSWAAAAWPALSDAVLAELG